MILSDQDIIKEIKNKEIIIKPFKKDKIQPASVDLHLDKNFLVFNTLENYVVDPKEKTENLMNKVVINKDKPFILNPQEFALGLVLEETGVSNRIVARLEGKSSLARLGLIIHTTAGYLDPGNCLKMTLEFFNAGQLPIKLHYGMPICQMSFIYLSSPCIKPYGSKGLNSKYFKNQDVKASMSYKNFKK